MKKLLVLPSLVIYCLMLAACEPIEQTARDTSAALGGAIVAAQGQNQAACKAAPSASVCVFINRAVAAQNALITATEAYCGVAVGISAPTATCTPVKSAQAGLQAAISNANPFITSLKGVIQ
jgi:hypothetical protein